MKIIELEINNMRGIKHLKIAPNGDNVVVFGHNGTGKSAIVDGIDFLLTGRISRLTGEGTGNLSLKDHGPHVDHRTKLGEVFVKAKIKLDGCERIIELERGIDSPTKLKIEPEQLKSILMPYLYLAELGQHVLSRREILRYITAESGERAKDVQSLLNLEVIEKLRTTFVTAQNNADRELKTSESNLNNSQRNICNILSLPSFSPEACLVKINELRSVLNGLSLTELAVTNLKESISPPAGNFTTPILSTEQINNHVATVNNILTSGTAIIESERELRTLLEEITRDVRLKKDLLHKKLLNLGISLIDNTNVCPLCEREWTTGLFKEYLEKRVGSAKIAQDKQESLERLSSFVRQNLESLRNSMDIILKGYVQFGLNPQQDEIKSYAENVKAWSEVMLSPEEYYPENKLPSLPLIKLLDKSFIGKKMITPIEKAIQEKGQNLSKEQQSWDTLTKMETLWEQYKNAFNKMEVSRKFKERADAVLNHFETARDSVLEGIYDAVTANFDSYYKCVHGDDEESFSSSFKHEGPALAFEVGFYDRGLFPPHALHSEGHQDSMGLCLYFALNKYLTKDKIKLIVLDDVVMSIDSNHRRGVCKFIKQFFSDRQLIITTHDSAWGRQLKTEGIVKRENLVHFVNWNIDTGPIVALEKDLWNDIKNDLTQDNVPSAAHKLRWNAECFFENVCDLLSAKVTYKGEHRWELGDYAPAAIGAYKGYLKLAKKIACDTKQQTKFDELEKVEEEAIKVIEDSKVEQWVINDCVHYNRWADFTKNDFKPVVGVFRSLFELFACKSCGSLVSLNYQGHMPKSISCTCGRIYWPLVKPDK